MQVRSEAGEEGVIVQLLPPMHRNGEDRHDEDTSVTCSVTGKSHNSLQSSKQRNVFSSLRATIRAAVSFPLSATFPLSSFFTQSALPPVLKFYSPVVIAANSVWVPALPAPTAQTIPRTHGMPPPNYSESQGRILSPGNYWREPSHQVAHHQAATPPRRHARRQIPRR